MTAGFKALNVWIPSGLATGAAGALNNHSGTHEPLAVVDLQSNPGERSEGSLDIAHGLGRRIVLQQGGSRPWRSLLSGGLALAQDPGPCGLMARLFGFA
ncbi:hypothetical protein NZK33_15970 [Cyanobium sp. FGCU-6]|nr:hypothetical protein [Cyanobium sp. FGCU6]